MTTTLTKTQIEALAPYEKHFRCAIDADWSPHPGRAGLETMHRILHDVTGDTRRLNDNCQHCILALVRDTGRLYFAAVAENVANPADEGKKGKVVAAAPSKPVQAKKTIKTAKK